MAERDVERQYTGRTPDTAVVGMVVAVILVVLMLAYFNPFSSSTTGVRPTANPPVQVTPAPKPTPAPAPVPDAPKQVPAPAPTTPK